MSNSNSNLKGNTYDLEPRVAGFVRDVIDLIKKLPRTRVSYLVSDQLMRSVTSVGANYFEFTECITHKDKVSKLAISKKEAKETKFWLLVLHKEFPSEQSQIEVLGKESQELVKIFATIISRLK